MIHFHNFTDTEEMTSNHCKRQKYLHQTNYLVSVYQMCLWNKTKTSPIKNHILQVFYITGLPVFSPKMYFNPFPKKPWFLHVYSTSLLKTLREKEKLLLTSNFSFSPKCFLPCLITFCHFLQIQNCCMQTLSVRNLSFGKRLNTQKEMVFETILGKR